MAGPAHGGTRGFTLVELMIVVVVIAILVAIGYPTYLDQVRKARRSDATTALMQVAQRLERCYTDRNKYNDTSSGGCPSGSIDSPEGYYSVAITASTNTYTLTATPKAGTTQAGDSTCASFTLDQAGTRGAKDSGGNDTTSTCWQN